MASKGVHVADQLQAERNKQSMPTVQAWMDGLRAAFGKDEIDAVIRRGIKPDCRNEHRVFASEGGRTIGQRFEYDAARSCTSADWLRSSAMMGKAK